MSEAERIPGRIVAYAGLMTAVLALVLGLAMLAPVPPRVPQVDYLDKLAHVAAFFLLVLPLASVLSARSALLGLLALMLLYGGLIEIVQPMVGRGAEWMDFLADALGAFAGLALGRWLHPRLSRRLTPDAGGNAGSFPLPSWAARR